MRRLSKKQKRMRHLHNLASVFNVQCSEIMKDYPIIQAIEETGHKLAEQYCNGDIDADGYDKEIQDLKERLKKTVLGKSLIFKEILFNGDPRGYFLKINDSYTRKNKLEIERDWGNYGIISPENI